MEKRATFASDAAKVDALNLVFCVDGNMEDELNTGDAVWCYLWTILLPWQRDHTEEDARDLMLLPRLRIVAETQKPFCGTTRSTMVQKLSTGRSQSPGASLPKQPWAPMGYRQPAMPFSRTVISLSSRRHTQSGHRGRRSRTTWSWLQRSSQAPATPQLENPRDEWALGDTCVHERAVHEAPRQADAWSAVGATSPWADAPT